MADKAEREAEANSAKSKAADAELAAKGAALKIHIEHSDMPEEMQETLKQMVRDAFVKATVYKDLATQIKQHFEKKYPPPDNKATSGVYHCVVGSNFAASVTHETYFACHLKCNNISVVLFRSKDSATD